MSVKKTILIGLLLLIASSSGAQALGFSIATDISVQRSWKKEQQYWAVGHDIIAQFHFTPTDALYTWFVYYSNGKFSNAVTATAKSPLTTPQQVNFTNNASMRMRQFSIGWKKYLKGRFDAETGWNFYGLAGLGIIGGRTSNTHSLAIDTNIYQLPVRSGEGRFFRLTADLGLGGEIALGGDVFVYAECRAWLPASDYPSKYVVANKQAPLVTTAHAGIRILF